MLRNYDTKQIEKAIDKFLETYRMPGGFQLERPLGTVRHMEFQGPKVPDTHPRAKEGEQCLTVERCISREGGCMEREPVKLELMQVDEVVYETMVSIKIK